jgi:hypothetical protein
MESSLRCGPAPLGRAGCYELLEITPKLAVELGARDVRRGEGSISINDPNRADAGLIEAMMDPEDPG